MMGIKEASTVKQDEVPLTSVVSRADLPPLTASMSPKSTCKDSAHAIKEINFTQAKISQAKEAARRNWQHDQSKSQADVSHHRLDDNPLTDIRSNSIVEFYDP